MKSVAKWLHRGRIVCVTDALVFDYLFFLIALWTSARGMAVTNVGRTCGPTPLHTCTCKGCNKIFLYYLLGKS